MPALEAGSSIGGNAVGFAIGCIFYGITVSQAYVYFRSFDRDPLWIVGMAISVILLETAHTVVMLRQLFVYSSVPPPELFGLRGVDWSVPVCFILEIVIEMFVNGFYIHRIWKLSRSLPLTIGTTTIFSSRVVTFLVWLIGMSNITSLPPTQSSPSAMDWPRAYFFIATSLAIASDTIMASIIVYHLWWKSKPTTPRARGIVSWLIVYYVNTGVILVSLSVAVLIAFTVSPGLVVWVSLINVFAKVLSNSFFGVLNSRELLRAKMGSLLMIDTVPYASQAPEIDMERARAGPIHLVSPSRY